MKHCTWCANNACLGGACVCVDDCGQTGCPAAIVDDYVPPPVPVFRRDDAA